METDPVEDHAVPKDDTTLNAIDSSENGNANASKEPQGHPFYEEIIQQGSVADQCITESDEDADDDAAPSDQSNHNEAAVQEADPFADSPPLECQRVPDNRFPNDDEERGRKSAALERQMADHEIERIVIQKKMADFKHQLEVLKKKNQALMNDPALQTITKSHRPSFEHDSVHALERAGANRETPAEDSYLVNMRRIEQRVTETNWETVFLLCSGVKCGQLAISEEDLKITFQDGRKSFFSCMRRVALSIFRLEAMKYFSLNGSKGSATRHPTLRLPDSCLTQFTELAYKIGVHMKGKWRISKKGNGNIFETDVIAKRVLSNLLAERRPRLLQHGAANQAHHSSSSENGTTNDSVL